MSLRDAAALAALTGLVQHKAFDQRGIDWAVEHAELVAEKWVEARRTR